jgi:hypothetical protein
MLNVILFSGIHFWGDKILKTETRSRADKIIIIKIAAG